MRKPTDPFSQQAQDVDLHVVQAFDEGVTRALDGSPDTGPPCQPLATPTEGRTGGRWVAGVRHGVVWSGAGLAHATVRHRRAEPGARHPRAPPWNPSGFCPQHRGDTPQRSVATPQAPVHLGLRLRGLQHRASPAWARRQRGPQNPAGVVWLQRPQRRVIRPALGCELPVDGLAGRGRGRAALPSSGFRGHQGGAVPLGLPPCWGHRRERGVGGRRRPPTVGRAGASGAGGSSPRRAGAPCSPWPRPAAKPPLQTPPAPVGPCRSARMPPAESGWWPSPGAMAPRCALA